MSTQGDPVLEAQARNRKALDTVLGKHGWKLGKVGLRAGSSVVTYELIRLSDNKTIEARVLLTEIEALRQENEALRSEVERHRIFARKVAKLMNSESREENALLQIQIINDLESAGYLPKDG